ncbi:hypothetical protein DITRI_Ditri18aG0073600 [Diplodiscus trichospermus]
MLTRNSASKTPQPNPVRRSARLLNQKTPIKSKDCNAQEAKSKENPARSTVKISKKPIKSCNGSTNCMNSASRLRRSPRFNSVPSKLSTTCVSSTPGLRKSPRLNSGSLSNKPEEIKFVETKKVRSRKDKSIDGGLLDEEKREVERKESEIRVGLKAVMVEGRESERREVCVRNEDVGVKGKKKPDEGGDMTFQGWTREQELALQRAYFSTNPTPNFWKKVSKLVPGKSAQDCFDKIHSDHLTPAQPQPRSRAKRLNLSPIENLSFSASKLLKPSALGNKRSGCSKRKSHLIQKKTVRHLLRKHYHVDQGDESDLFSILEPNAGQSMHALPNVMLSTPTNLLEKQGFLQKCHERSSGTKKHSSKLGNSCTTALTSPPVLKQIKNRALHEKYIDQLHSRDAKRKAESARAGKEVLGKENKGSIQVQKIDEVRAAKNALVSDAKHVINQLQLQTTSVDNSLDLDNDDYDDDDEEEECEINL